MEEELRQVENTLLVKLETVFLGIEKDVCMRLMFGLNIYSLFVH